MVTEVISPWEAVTFHAAVAAFEPTIEGFVTMSMHPMGFSFVSEQAGYGGELLARTLSQLAGERLEVRVNVFALVQHRLVKAVYSQLWR